MPDLKLPKLPDRTPIRLTISITPDLQAALNEYPPFICHRMQLAE